MIDKLIEIGAMGDLITPIASILQDIANGPSCGFGLPRDIGISARDVEKLLKSKGVKVWGLMVVDDMIIFRTRKAQAPWTRYLLERHGIPILYAPKESGANQSKKEVGLIDWFIDLLFGG